jgi:hypothetical protein
MPQIGRDMKLRIDGWPPATDDEELSVVQETDAQNGAGRKDV